MVRKLGVVVAVLGLLALMGGTASAQDAKAVLQAASKAMGNLKTVQITGTGWNAAVGQSFSQEEDWPRFEVTRYVRTIDFDARTSREEFTRRQGNYPPRGGGGTPIQGEQQQVFIVSGNSAWNMVDGKPVPQPGQYLAGLPLAEFRALDIVLTPHGFLRAAQAAGANPTAISLTLGSPTGAVTPNGKQTLVSITAMGKYKVIGTFDDQNLLAMVHTWVPNPVYGDMLYELRYTNYKDFGGVKYPTTLHIHQGDPRLMVAHNSMEITLSNVQPNLAVPAVTVPAEVQKATAPPVRAESQKLADGVWLIAGGTHNSLAVDFRDFVTVIEAPLNEERSLAVIAEVSRLIPNKPIRYVVNTHHHFDHSGGLRTYMAQGATIVSHQANDDFLENVLLSPGARTMMPDRFSTYYPYFSGGRRPLPIEEVNQKYVISDGVRTLELHPMQGLNHHGGMLIAYFPKEKILVNADLYTPPAQGAQAPPPNANMRSLRQNIQRLKLDVERHVPIHGQPGPADQFTKIVGTSTN